ncbi:response regulator transcription factor, partial [Microbacterium sp. 69-10]|uniref:response regulator transcription factor n=1 Tax=Microbacterium sp. 69-10 TaxID=1895783 RepID=UPI0025FAE855
PPPPLPSGEILTPREIELVRLVADGLSNLEIGERMHLSEPTIKTHMGHVLAKLGMRDRLQVAVWAHRSGTAR